MRKFLIIGSVFCLLFVGSAGLALAVDDNGRIDSILEAPVVSTSSAPVENIPATINAENKAGNLMTQAAKLIKERINALSKMNRTISTENIADKSKKELKTEVSKQVNSLNSLGAQIKSTTNLNTLKDKVKSIFYNYRTFAVFVPKTQSTLSLDKQQDHLKQLNNAFAVLQARIDKAKAKGFDVTARQKALDQAKAALPQLTDKLNSLQAQVKSLDPSDYPATSVGLINSINAGIKDADQKFKEINKILKAQPTK